MADVPPMMTEEEMMAMANAPEPTINQSIGPEGAAGMLQPDEDIQVVLLSRLESLTPEELMMLDSMIDSNTAQILLKILPELQQLMDTFLSQGGGGRPAGALSGM